MRKLPENRSRRCLSAAAPNVASDLRQVAIGLGLVGLFSGCAGASDVPPPPPRPAVSAVASATSAPSAGPSATASSLPPAPSALASVAPVPSAPRGPLATFHEALAALKRGTRKDHVRVMWLGDSHAQADFWPHAIRSGLQTRFGVGGPGFLRIGFKEYRSSSASIKVDGSWRMRPKRPSTIKPWADGAFGLGGILHAGYAGQRRARITLTDEQLKTRKLKVELCYKHGLATDQFRWSVSGSEAQTVKASSDADIGVIRYLTAETRGLAKIEVVPRAGRPDFCGVIVETDAADGAGVVLDNLGINGARYGTALAWNEDAWAKAVKRRPPPELFIFEYGGNEASDLVSTPDVYRDRAIAMIARARRIRPDASCLVIAPSDRADAEDRIPPIVDAMEQAAASSKCHFWNTYEKMGGRGSLRKWRTERKASPDGIHLRQNGYAVLGEWLLRDMLAGMAL